MSTAMPGGVAVLDRAPVVRVLPVPRAEPPADEDWTDGDQPDLVMTAPTLPLRLHSAGVEPRRRSGRSSGRACAAEQDAVAPGVGARYRPGDVVLIPVDDPVGGVVDGAAPSGASRAPTALPEVKAATQRFVATFLEVTAGFRPVAHLRQHCRADRYDRITDHLRGQPADRHSPAKRGAAALAGRVLIVGRTAAGGPPRVGRVAPRAPGDRLTLRRVQICQVSASVAEVVVVVSRREASAAMAFRLEQAGGRWLCVHLEIV